MSISQRDLDELVDANECRFTVVVREPDGADRSFSGRGVANFVRNRSETNHPYRVMDTRGHLVYSRDDHGIVHVGNAEELLQTLEREKVIGTQKFVDSIRSTIRFASRGLRG